MIMLYTCKPSRTLQFEQGRAEAEPRVEVQDNRKSESILSGIETVLTLLLSGVLQVLFLLNLRLHAIHISRGRFTAIENRSFATL